MATASGSNGSESYKGQFPVAMEIYCTRVGACRSDETRETNHFLEQTVDKIMLGLRLKSWKIDKHFKCYPYSLNNINFRFDLQLLASLFMRLAGPKR